MLTALVASIRSVPSALRRITQGNRPEPESLVSRQVGLDLVPARVLPAGEFGGYLERERSLADRGTRRFCLLVLQRRTQVRGHDALPDLALRLRERLRSTDLVGQIDSDRIEVLLTDTETEGAECVGHWVGQVETRLGLELERTIYVYPSVAEPGAEDERDDPPLPGPGSNTPGAGRGVRRRVASAVAQLRASSLPWPVRDLWPLLGFPTPRWKRAADIVLSGAALLCLLPLLALVALAIRLDSPGPAIFRQLRAGRGGRPFVFFKFRSMNVDAEEQRASLAARNEREGPIFKIQDDPRITRVGRWLRRASIDELPQLWNVFTGDISLVGPRSPTVDELQKYERWQRRRLCVAGGLTCTWQVSGRSQISFPEWMRLDMRYVASRTAWLDFRLLLRRLPAVISGRGAF